MTASPTSLTDPLVVIVQARAALGNAEAAKALIARFVEPTLSEPGCRQYRLLTDVSDDHRIVLIEEWESQAALAAHQETPDFAELMADLMPLLADEGSGMFLRAVA